MKLVLLDAALLYAALMTAAAGAQARPIGTVAAGAAEVTNGAGGSVALVSGRTLLTGNSTVKAREQAADISLTRGGMVRVCQTSGLHLVPSGAQDKPDDLLLALDRGGMELHMKASAGDTLMTPDLRFTPASAGTLDLLVRVASNGDTCVDNRGRKAPALKVVDAYGQQSYEVKPGQHILFEHGSLLEVVDRETTPCGCPVEEKPVPLAEALLRGGKGTVTPKQAAAANPFPEAVSAGMAEPAPLPPEKPGETHVQVSTTLHYDPNAKPAVPEVPADGVSNIAPNAAPTPPAARPEPIGGLHAIGRFLKRLFVR